MSPLSILLDEDAAPMPTDPLGVIADCVRCGDRYVHDDAHACPNCANPCHEEDRLPSEADQ